MAITDEIRKNLTNTTALYVAAGTADLAVQKLRELPEQLPKLREQAQSLALQGVGLALEYAVKARETYDGLAERGRTVVGARLGDPAAQESAGAKPEDVAPEFAEEIVVERADARGAGDTAKREPTTEPKTEPKTEPRGEAKSESGSESGAKTRSSATRRSSTARRRTGTTRSESDA